MSLTSGINAIAHSAEGLYSADRNPVIDFMARDGIAALGRALPAICRDPADLQARTDAFYGAWLCGIVMGSVGMALHHKLCHTLGGTFNLPHAETHTAVLPHALAYNAPAAPEAMAKIAQALGGASGPAAVFTNAMAMGNAPRAVARVVIRIGLKRATDASSTASILFIPFSLCWLANSTMRIPFLVTKPISMMIPIWEKIFSDCPKTDKLITAPASARGTVIMMIKGSTKLSNCAASTRKINTRAKRKAFCVLEELSAKSLEDPLRLVVNDSSSTFFEMRSISLMPSPSVLPLAKPADTMALFNLL
jgi:hypothetical protein